MCVCVCVCPFSSMMKVVPQTCLAASVSHLALIGKEEAWGRCVGVGVCLSVCLSVCVKLNRVLYGSPSPQPYFFS